MLSLLGKIVLVFSNLQFGLDFTALLLFYQNCSKPICQTKVEASFLFAWNM